MHLIRPRRLPIHARRWLRKERFIREEGRVQLTDSLTHPREPPVVAEWEQHNLPQADPHERSVFEGLSIERHGSVRDRDGKRVECEQGEGSIKTLRDISANHRLNNRETNPLHSSNFEENKHGEMGHNPQHEAEARNNVYLEGTMSTRLF